MTVEVIRAAGLAGIAHGFLGRRGGVSTGVVAGLNVGSGSEDNPAAVAQNVRLACAAVLPGAAMARVYQVHSEVAVVAEEWAMDERPRADALVTDRPGLLLGIVTADCAPVLLADREAGVIGAAHAGWRGALDGVTDAAIVAMEGLGARRERIVAAVGPCIGQASYEVDEGFRERFLAADPSNARFFRALPTPHFDLEAYVLARLQAAGIGAIEGVGLDTYADEQRFFSYRRATHLGQGDYGRQFSLIGLAP
ncbi:peptidoglycan editing factor PgeF [Sphingomonas sp. RB1R13]|uniref:peptidoglycan editing factor PgeF n=1 Tax=Sphingomonas sp. RB1R13 TaxID=3096159 RepID=UPI002FCA11B5